MRTEQYNYIYKRLENYEDIAKLSSKLRLPKELLLVIYTQKTIRRASKDFYKMKNRLDKIKAMWNNGTSFTQIARKFEFPPVLTAYLILTGEKGQYSKKGYRNLLHDPSQIKDDRLKREIIEVVENDRIYSPKGADVQKNRGIKGEDTIQKWLDERGIDYRTEEDLRGDFPKTPDFLFDVPLYHRGSEVFWIESKASFGDKIEVNKNLKKQLIPYQELFRDGIVIFHFGVVDNVPLVDGILIENQDFFMDYQE